jgi:hypothetical protein
MTRRSWFILGLLLGISAVAMLSGCAPAKVVYGAAGPGFQHDIYHPKIDPLFRYGDWQ